MTLLRLLLKLGFILVVFSNLSASTAQAQDPFASDAQTNEVNFEQYKLVQNFLNSNNPEQYYLSHQIEVDELTRSPAGSELLTDAIKKMGQPSWSLKILAKSELTREHTEDSEDSGELASAHLQQAEKFTKKDLSNPSMGKWVGISAVIFILGAEFMKNKKFVVTGLRY